MTSDRIDDDVLRARLDRLVPTPDDMAGWTGVRRGVQRAHQRRRGMVVAGAGVALTAALVGGILVASSGQSGDQRLRTANPPITATPTTPTTYANVPAGPGPDGAPAATGTTEPASTEVGASPVAPAGTAPATISGPTSATAPAGAGSSSTTPPTSTAPTTVVPTTDVTRPSVPTTTTPSDQPALSSPVSVPSTTDTAPSVPTIDQVQDGVERLAARNPDLVRSITQLQVAGRSVLAVSLRADGEQLAQEITTLWPDQTVVQLGFFVYGTLAGSATDLCPTVSSTDTSDLALTSSAVLSPSPIPSGHDFIGMLKVTNHGTSPATFTTGLSSQVDLLPPGSSQVVGCYGGPPSTITTQGTIAPGASASFTLSGGTASVNRALGYSVPAGTYVGLVHITIDGMSVPFTFPVTITS